ncbi:molybdopterin-dependent oxidoreductase [Nocardioides sp. Leaf307]|uniref:molybdopterin-dependent oxidoreductase n=1 Tax=Nocardioides sp. Leaf307 TaxID=1736331 RepID=UPI000703B715|nr:molybdopterin-dependent oxidoreductase [Nocardioides sp. Leaf307]KQQ42726.1 hypothetical protein ASF50_01380 [Nocardioides sp. Leaf307]
MDDLTTRLSRTARATVRAAAPLVLLLLALGSACSQAPDAPGSAAGAPPVAEVTTLAPATLEPGDEVPAPTGPVVLTITGGSVHNVGDRLELDRALLDRLGSVSYEADDDQATGGRRTFSGPLVATLLEVAGAGDATVMATHAINDYTADVPVSDASAYPLMLATRTDGEPMDVAGYGPTRFVYPTEGAPELDSPEYDARWVWQLDRITLR